MELVKIMSCYSNPLLNCIDALISQDKSNWTKDGFANYGENCNILTGVDANDSSNNKVIVSIYNLQGQVVDSTFKGLVLYHFSDGTSQKIIQE